MENKTTFIKVIGNSIHKSAYTTMALINKHTAHTDRKWLNSLNFVADATWLTLVLTDRVSAQQIANFRKATNNDNMCVHTFTYAYILKTVTIDFWPGESV